MPQYRIYAETFIEAKNEKEALADFAHNSFDFAASAEIEIDKPKRKTRENKLEELYERAINRYLNKTDFDYTEWLEEKELNQYAKTLSRS